MPRRLLNSAGAIFVRPLILLVIVYSTFLYFYKFEGSSNDTKELEKQLNIDIEVLSALEKELNNKHRNNLDNLRDLNTKNASEISRPPITFRRNSRSKSDILFGMAINIDLPMFFIFCSSLRRYSNADVVLFMNLPLTKEYHDIVTANEISVVDVNKELLRLKTKYPFITKYHPSSVRWPLMYNYLQKHADSYVRVLIIDVRDSVFQADPFIKLVKGKSIFYAFEEGRNRLVGDCQWNREWINDCFGTEILYRTNDHKILCSGVSLASKDTALVYLKLMSQIILGISGIGNFPNCERNGVDQGIYNVLIHQVLRNYSFNIPNIKILPDENGIVVNMQNGATHFNAKYIVTNDGKPINIVHQYDRNNVVKNLIFHQYNQSMILNTSKTEVTRRLPDFDGSCKDYMLTYNLDVLDSDGCGLSTSILPENINSVTDCCYYCSTIPTCKSFKYFPDSNYCVMKACTSPIEDPMDFWGGYTGLKIQ